MRPDALRQTIDRMVEESIRRILPTVMNEVLIRALVSSGALNEAIEDERPVRRKARKAPKRRKPVREAKRGRPNLSKLLDPSAGADFYRDPRQAQVLEEDDAYEEYEQEEIVEEVRRPSPLARRIDSLPAGLREMAEGMDLDDDGVGEMWGDDEHNSVPGMTESHGAGPISDPNPIRDVDKAAKAVGIDFNRMKGLIARTEESKPRADREDAKANAQFEAARLKRMREQLNGGKPLE